MTKEEIQLSSKKKVQAVTTLCKQLSLEPSAEQIITPEGFIRGVVYFIDTEKYEVDEEKPITPDKKPKNNKKPDDKS